jgi:hypothetical protein
MNEGLNRIRPQSYSEASPQCKNPLSHLYSLEHKGDDNTQNLNNFQ